MTNHKLFVSNLEHGEHRAPCWVYGWAMLTALLKKSVLNHLINWKEKHFQFSCDQAHSYVRLTAMFGKNSFSLWRTVKKKWSRLESRALCIVSEQWQNKGEFYSWDTEITIREFELKMLASAELGNEFLNNGLKICSWCSVCGDHRRCCPWRTTLQSLYWLWLQFGPLRTDKTRSIEIPDLCELL